MRESRSYCILWLIDYAMIKVISLVFLVAAVAACVGILWRPLLVDNPTGNRCLAMYVLLVFFYIGNVMPFHAISMLTPILAVLFQVMRGATGNGAFTILSPSQAAVEIVGRMLDSIGLIVLGSFCLAVALHQYRIAKAIGLEWIVHRAIKNASLLCLATMYLVLAGSYLMGSSPATFLLTALILERLEGVDNQQGSNIAKGLLMGLVSAGTIGSMSSPISSPHSNFAYYQLHLKGLWWPWLVASLPTTILATGIAWAINCYTFNLFDAEIPSLEESAGKKDFDSDTTDYFVAKQIYVAVVAICTFAGWLCSPLLREWIGNMGIISLFPIVAIFGAGLLNAGQLHMLRWDIFLMCLGGVALNEAVRSSGLIDTFTRHTLTILAYGNAYLRLLLLSGMIAISAILKSRFLTAFVILPVIAETVQRAVGKAEVVAERMTLYLVCTFACSAGQALATSGIISTAIAGSADRKGRPYLNQLDFLRVGLPTSLATFLCIVTVSYLVITYGWPVIFPSFL